MIFNTTTKKLFVLFGILFCWQMTFAQLEKEWKQIDTIVDHVQAVSKLNQLKEKTKKWSQENELSYSKRIGHRYIYLTKLDSALVYINKAIELSKTHKQDSVLAYMYKQKGTVYYYLTKNQTALENWKLALGIAEKNGYDELSSAVYSNVGVIHLERDQFDEAEKYLLRSIEINERLNQHSSQGNLLAYRLLATNYQDQKKYGNALPIFERLIQNCRSVNDSIVLSSALTFYAKCLNATGKKNQAYTAIEEALAIQKKMWDLQGLIAVLAFYSDMLEKNGEYKKALEKMKEAYDLKKQLFQEQMANAASDAEVKYKTDSITQQKKIAELKNKQSRQELQISENKRSKMTLLVLIVSISAIALFLLYFLYQQREKSKSEKKKGEELLNAIIEGEEKERTRIAKDLHDGIVQDLTAFKFELNVITESIPESNQSQLNNLHSEIGRISNEVRELSYQMMPITLKELGLIKAIEELLGRSFRRNNIKFDFDSFGITERLSQKIETTIYRITQELISNTIKHSQADYVSILLQIRNDVLQLVYEDNGIGFDAENVNRGIGLDSINSRIEMVSGSLEFDQSERKTGITAFIRIPLKTKTA